MKNFHDKLSRSARRWWWKHDASTRLKLKRRSIGFTLGIWLILLVYLIYLSIHEWVRDEADTVVLNWLVLGIVALLTLLSLVLSRQKKLPWLLEWFGNLNTEFAGAFILSALLLVLVTIPGERNAENQLKQQLIREMGGSDNGIALHAVEELKARDWLYDGSLQATDLERANLQGANLVEADLQRADLGGTNLQGADLYDANLYGAYLHDANLYGAYLHDANLYGADLIGANLQEANLMGANLQWAYLYDAILQEALLTGANLHGAGLKNANLHRANLIGANLQGAGLKDANLHEAFLYDVNLREANLTGANLQGTMLEQSQFNEYTILPDSTKWTPDTDLTQFTDPNHPHFWRGYNLTGEKFKDADFRNANLHGVDLTGTSLQGADLSGANMQGVFLMQTQFDETTKLPDGTSWTDETNMTRFTDPEHPNFWRSVDPASPAYWDDSE